MRQKLNRSNIKEIKEHLQGTAHQWVKQSLPNGRIISGNWRVGGLDGSKGGSLVISLNGHRAGNWIDFATGEQGDAISLYCELNGITCRELVKQFGDITLTQRSPQQSPEYDERQADLVQRKLCDLIEHSHPPFDTVVDTYLQSRGISGIPLDDVWLIPKYIHRPTRTFHPVMISYVRDVNGDVVGAHRTYLAEDGSGKANVSPNKMMYGQVKGGAVRLSEPLNGFIGVAEGIESALSASLLYGVPVWATLSTSGMMAFEPPEGITSIAIFADNDETGRKAANTLNDSLLIKSIVKLPLLSDFNEDLVKSVKYT